jgi:hypothetical protein
MQDMCEVIAKGFEVPSQLVRPATVSRVEDADACAQRTTFSQR